MIIAEEATCRAGQQRRGGRRQAIKSLAAEGKLITRPRGGSLVAE